MKALTLSTITALFALAIATGCSMDLSISDIAAKGPGALAPVIAVDGGLSPVAGEVVTTSNGYQVRASIGEIIPDETQSAMPSGWVIHGVIR
jgi:hypothetical protein